MNRMNPHLAPVAVPDPALLPHVQQLCDLTDPYAHGPAVDELFAAAMAETNAWHTERSAFFRSLYEATPRRSRTVRRSSTRTSSSATRCSRYPARTSSCT